MLLAEEVAGCAERLIHVGQWEAITVIAGIWRGTVILVIFLAVLILTPILRELLLLPVEHTIEHM